MSWRFEEAADADETGSTLRAESRDRCLRLCTCACVSPGPALDLLLTSQNLLYGVDGLDTSVRTYTTSS